MEWECADVGEWKCDCGGIGKGRMTGVGLRKYGIGAFRYEKMGC